MVVLLNHVRRQLYASARIAYPAEACGLILAAGLEHQKSPGAGRTVGVPPGPGQPVDDRIALVEYLPAENAAPYYLRHKRFQMDPRFILDAQRRCRERGREIVGIFHTHPDHIPVPSATDLQEAWPIYLYLILHVRQHDFGSLMAWRLAEQGGSFNPVKIADADTMPPVQA